MEKYFDTKATLILLCVYAVFAFFLLAGCTEETVTPNIPEVTIEYRGVDIVGNDKWDVWFSRTHQDSMKMGFSQDGINFHMGFLFSEISCLRYGLGSSPLPERWIKVMIKDQGHWFEITKKVK